MDLINMKMARKTYLYHERRKGQDRRISFGRRSMIRFDETGGDRRLGMARRSTDEGLRE
jgi:hypothetical protein